MKATVEATAHVLVELLQCKHQGRNHSVRQSRTLLEAKVEATLEATMQAMVDILQ